jgi:hypothetical protein
MEKPLISVSGFFLCTNVEVVKEMKFDLLVGQHFLRHLL